MVAVPPVFGKDGADTGPAADDEATAKFRAAESAMRDHVSEQLSHLSDAMDRLAARAAADMAVRQGSGRLLQDRQMLELGLDNAPEVGSRLAVFCEFESLVVDADTETVLLAAKPLSGRQEREAAYATLSLPMEAAVAKLDKAGVATASGFCDFAEACMVGGVSVSIVSRGFKPLIRHYLREAGLGHIAVHANDLQISRTGMWEACFRDNTPSGHNKAESMRRALAREKGVSIVYVGWAACDFTPVQEGLVKHLYTPAGSPLAQQCDAAGVRYREFSSWGALSTELL